MAQLVKKKICLQCRRLPAGDLGLIPGSGRSPGEENGNPFQYSCLGNPMDKGAWWATAHGVARVRHDLATKPSRQIRIYGWLPYSCRTSDLELRVNAAVGDLSLSVSPTSRILSFKVLF